MRSDDIVELVRLSHVPRWTIVPVLRPQSVGEHSHRVAAIASDLAEVCNDIGIGGRFQIVYLAMIHDWFEAWTGDIPASAKGMVSSPDPKVDGFPDLYHRIVKVADILEALTYLVLFGVPTNRRAEILSGLIDRLVEASSYVPQAVRDRASELVTLITEDGVLDGEDQNDRPQGGVEASGRGGADNRDGGGDLRRSLLRLLPALPGRGESRRGPGQVLPE